MVRGGEARTTDAGAKAKNSLRGGPPPAPRRHIGSDDSRTAPASATEGALHAGSQAHDVTRHTDTPAAPLVGRWCATSATWAGSSQTVEYSEPVDVLIAFSLEAREADFGSEVGHEETMQWVRWPGWSLVNAYPCEVAIP